MFPKIGVFPPKSSILIRFSIINQPYNDPCVLVDLWIFCDQDTSKLGQGAVAYVVNISGEALKNFCLGVYQMLR